MADPGCRDVIELLFGLRAVRRLLGGTIKAITQRVTPTFIPGWYQTCCLGSVPICESSFFEYIKRQNQPHMQTSRNALRSKVRRSSCISPFRCRHIRLEHVAASSTAGSTAMFIDAYPDL
jgi:hypothetical protein